MKKIVIDVYVNGKKWGRCGTAENGAYTAMIGNLPSLPNEFRAQCLAGNGSESWHYQFPDLTVGDKVTFKIVESTWWDPPDSIEARAKPSQA